MHLVSCSWRWYCPFVVIVVMPTEGVHTQYVPIIRDGTADVGSDDAKMSEEGENAEYYYRSTLPDPSLGRGEKRYRYGGGQTCKVAEMGTTQAAAVAPPPATAASAAAQKRWTSDG